MDYFEAREEIYRRLVTTLRTRAAKSLPIWLFTIGLAFIYGGYLINWIFYVISLLLIGLFFGVCIPNLGTIVTLNTKFYGGMERSIKNTVPISYLGALSTIYACLALWLHWNFLVGSIVVSFICAFVCGLQGWGDK